MPSSITRWGPVLAPTLSSLRVLQLERKPAEHIQRGSADHLKNRDGSIIDIREIRFALSLQCDVDSAPCPQMVTNAALNAWFRREVLPLEPVLTRFIRRHWRSSDELADIRQDVYERVLIGASRALPDLAGPYIFTVARNVIINRARRAKIIKIDLVAELEQIVPGADWLTPARHVEAREELRRVQAGLEVLPPRCRDILRLRKVQGLSTREAADQLGIGIDAVEQQTTMGMRALTDFMLGGEGRVLRRPRARANKYGPAS